MKEVVSPYSHLSQSRLLRPVASMMGWMAQGCVASCPEKERKFHNFSILSKISKILKTAMRTKGCEVNHQSKEPCVTLRPSVIQPHELWKLDWECIEDKQAEV